MITKYLAIKDTTTKTAYVFEVTQFHDIKYFDLDEHYIKMYIESKLNKKVDNNISYMIYNTAKQVLELLAKFLQDEGYKINIQTLTKYQKQVTS